MASNVGLSAEAVAIVSNEQTVLVIPREGLDTDEAVRAWVPINRLAGCWVERTELLTLNNLATERQWPLALTEAGPGATGAR